MIASKQALSVMYRDTITLLTAEFRDNDAINPLANSHTQLEDGRIIFSMAAIYHQIKTSQSPPYNHYRRMMFSSQLNSDLRLHQLKVSSYGMEQSTNIPLYYLEPITVTAAGT